LGEAKRRLAAVAAAERKQAVITDIDEVGKILWLERTYCDQCGAAFPLWPPEELNEHLHAEHPGMFWPSTTAEWDSYKNDPDLARRQNYVTAYRVKFLFLVLQNRCDLYEKLVAAGVIVAPAQG
jgi:hypothetical protein